jgi:mutator protein MutT
MAEENSPQSRVEVAIAVVEHDGRFLIGLRPEGMPLAGYWEFPGGKVHEGESPENAAIRECLEETGLAARVQGAYPHAKHDYEHASVRLHFFACEPVEQQRTLPSRFRWAAVVELAQYKFPPANAALLRIIANRVAS